MHYLYHFTTTGIRKYMILLAVTLLVEILQMDSPVYVCMVKYDKLHTTQKRDKRG